MLVMMKLQLAFAGLKLYLQAERCTTTTTNINTNIKLIRSKIEILSNLTWESLRAFQGAARGGEAGPGTRPPGQLDLK